MLILGLTLLLAAIGIAVMPCWRHSAAGAMARAPASAAFLICVGIFAAGGRAGPSEALSERLAAQPKSGAYGRGIDHRPDPAEHVVSCDGVTP